MLRDIEQRFHENRFCLRHKVEDRMLISLLYLVHCKQGYINPTLGIILGFYASTLQIFYTEMLLNYTFLFSIKPSYSTQLSYLTYLKSKNLFYLHSQRLLYGRKQVINVKHQFVQNPQGDIVTNQSSHLFAFLHGDWILIYEAFMFYNRLLCKARLGTLPTSMYIHRKKHTIFQNFI